MKELEQLGWFMNIQYVFGQNATNIHMYIETPLAAYIFTNQAVWIWRRINGEKQNEIFYICVCEN